MSPRQGSATVGGFAFPMLTEKGADALRAAGWTVTSGFDADCKVCGGSGDFDGQQCLCGGLKWFPPAPRRTDGPRLTRAELRALIYDFRDTVKANNKERLAYLCDVAEGMRDG